MFIPLFIAILLGLVNPSTTTTPPAGSGTTVNINSNGEDPSDTDPGDQDPGDDTGGETGSVPPKKP
ncbi:hypothetical protein [Pedobacter agri]|uniref:Uncharacterized protein n=1 Tax=Pedobacter agri TaxID=454586 RepID=A0A9X3DBF6_9SPHI|nr:hypothetical protein [Pedobacter agri]MCX3264527.1 hypothetical protein [Pedobacter agri]